MMAGLSRSTNIRVINRRTGTAPPLTACALHTHPPNPEVVGCLTGRSISGSGAVPYGASPRGGTFFSDTLSLLAASYLFEEVFSADLAALEDELHAIQVGGVGMRAA
jgi:hypothetical protein